MGDDIRMAVGNIAKKGDTDIFPFPVERFLFYDKRDETEEILSELAKEQDQADGIEYINTSLPVSYTGYRRATMIEPVWNALYLSEVLKIAAQVESKRIPVDKATVFSYRFRYDEVSGKLFDDQVRWRAYYSEAGDASKLYEYVVMFDIADFYGRISHLILEDVLLKEIEADAATVDRIMEMLAGLSPGNEKQGLPVGGNASRILAEAFLVRADNFLLEKGIRFCRFVDDIILFADSMDEAFGFLNQCADFFYRILALSLQKNKTDIMTAREFRVHAESIEDKIEGGKDSSRSAILKLNLHLDPYSLTADENLRKLKTEISAVDIIGLLISEFQKSKINQLFSRQVINAIQYTDSKGISGAYKLLSGNLRKLYPLFPLIMRRAYYDLQSCTPEVKNLFITKLQDLFEEDSYILQTQNNAAYAVRVLSLEDSERTTKILDILYRNSADENLLVRLNVIYAMTNLGRKEWLLASLNTFERSTVMVRRTLVIATCFLDEEGRKWREDQKHSFTPMESLAVSWAMEKLEERTNWKLPL